MFRGPISTSALNRPLLVSPKIYDRSLWAGGSQRQLVDLGFLVVLSRLLALVGLAVVRRMALGFLTHPGRLFAGLLRVPPAALELTGCLPTRDPTWYVVVQAVVGVIQFLIATAMFMGYRRSRVWGELVDLHARWRGCWIGSQPRRGALAAPVVSRER